MTEALYFRALVELHASDRALVGALRQHKGVGRKHLAALAAGIAKMRSDGVTAARVSGLGLSSIPGLPALVVAFDDGRAGFGVVLSNEAPMTMTDAASACLAEADDVPPGFMLLGVPVGVVRGALQ